MMIEEAFSEAERQLMKQLAVDALARRSAPDHALVDLIAMLGGVDTVIVARRAYPAKRRNVHGATSAE